MLPRRLRSMRGGYNQSNRRPSSEPHACFVRPTGAISAEAEDLMPPHLSSKKRSRRAAVPTAPDDVELNARTSAWAENLTVTSLGGTAQSLKRRASDEMRKTVRASLASFTPMHIMIDSDHEIVQLHGNAGRYLELAPGRASFSLFGMLREGLAGPLEGALLTAGRLGRTVRKHQVKVRT